MSSAKIPGDCGADDSAEEVIYDSDGQVSQSGETVCRVQAMTFECMGEHLELEGGSGWVVGLAGSSGWLSR